MRGQVDSHGQGSLFDEAGDEARPLADRMRPTSLDEVVGQSHQIGPGKALRSMIEADRTPSMIFWGPPGVGKTTLARVIARRTQAVPVSRAEYGLHTPLVPWKRWSLEYSVFREGRPQCPP